MTPEQDLPGLRTRLVDLDGKGYKAYKGIEGAYAAPAFTLHIDHVQGDPFAEPSRFRAEVPPHTAALPAWALETPTRRRAVADFLNRVFVAALHARSAPGGSGKSGQLHVLEPRQQVLARSSLEVAGDGAVRARFRVGLPARGRRINGRAAADLVCGAVPAAVEAALLFPALDAGALRRHLETVEDSVALRDALDARGLVAFVADGARLPRRSGIDDRPLETGVTPFESPPTLRTTLETPNAGPVTGMGIPMGITLIVGGGYHGKSTLLEAIERGIYDHVPGDGRERVVARSSAVKVRAEDGRRVAGTDISNFIGRLPSGGDTRRFFTENASGSTSQAAAIVEALELGCGCLLLDEDTSATNFMIRDARMQALIAEEHEPITPFIDRVRQIHDTTGTSVVLVVGGSGDYFDVADTVIAMKEYRPQDVSAEAREVAASLPTRRGAQGRAWRPIALRAVDPASIDASRHHRDVAIRVLSTDRVAFGEDRVELAAVEQLVESAQTRAIAYAVQTGRARLGAGGLPEALNDIMRWIDDDGLAAVHPYAIGELAEFRVFELGAFLNRLRSLTLFGSAGGAGNA